MDNFLRYFYQDVGSVFRAFVDIFASFFNFVNYLFNFPMRLKLIRELDGSFTVGEWVMLIITEIVLVAIGPLCNMAELLRSGADEYSDKDGKALVTEKVSEIYVMGGAFRPKADGKPTAEWNILQDVGSARYFAANCPVPIVFSPHELGARVFTYPEDMPGPVRYSMTSFAEAAGESVDGFKRESWDPVTCLAAIDGEKYGLKIGENGVVSIDEEGVTSFVPDKNGKHRILRLDGGAEELERAIALAAGK